MILKDYFIQLRVVKEQRDHIKLNEGEKGSLQVGKKSLMKIKLNYHDKGFVDV